MNAPDLDKSTVLGPSAAPAPIRPLAEESIGSRIGRYTLEQKVGEGGFGAVYIAQQEEPVRRRVALKIIKLGMDTRSVVARFEAERQALAVLDHPNIAKVFDAGATESGRPYFVMEFVQGRKLTEYCDAHQTSVRERLGLFMQVCEAVQHAHQKGIIHRDLKPSNVLVSEGNGPPVPKVIDFGIAKATGGALTDLTLCTAPNQLLGTPGYMSPEQARLSGEAQGDIDTRTDIYSLGVLLYELLTGKTPFETRELLRIGLEAMLQAVREQEPPWPSTRLSTLEEADLSLVAQLRSMEPPKLLSVLRGDLDWIVMKCLEKERGRRYETANALRADLDRHLQDEPVVARPPERIYRLKKFVARNKVAVAAAAAVGLALVLGLCAASWGFIKERAGRQAAQTAQQAATAEAIKSQQVAAFLKKMLIGVQPSVALGRDTTMLREILDKTVESLSDLKDQPAVEADLRDILGRAYMDLGQYPEAESMHRRALSLRRSITGSEHPEVAASLNNLGTTLLKAGKYSEAEKNLREGLSIQTKARGRVSVEAAATLHNLRLALMELGRIEEAENIHREVLAIQNQLLEREHPDVDKGRTGEGLTLLQAGKYAQAEQVFGAVLEAQRKALGEDHPLVGAARINLGAALVPQGKYDQAVVLFRQVLEGQKKIVGPEHPELAIAMNNLGAALMQKGDHAEAEGLFRRVLPLQRKRLGQEHPDIATCLGNLGATLWHQEKWAEAEPFFRDALEMHRRLLGSEHPSVAKDLSNLAVLLSTQKKYTEAETLQREALAIRRKLLGNEHPDVAASLVNLGAALEGQKQYAEAESSTRQALAMQKKLLGETHPDVAASLKQLRHILELQGKTD